MLSLVGVSKSHGGLTALHPLNFEVQAGEVVALVGPSGAGKSTLLRLIAALDAPSTGEVKAAGITLTDATAEAYRRKLGFVVQGGGLFPHLSAHGNVTLMAKLLGWPAERIEERVKLLAELVRLPLESMSRYPVQLSGGQAQRVSLMRALMLDPEALLLDEPLGALDPVTRHQLQAELRQIFERLKKTVVLVTHDLGEAFFFASRVVLLRDGRVVQDGSPKLFRERPAEPFVREFVEAHRCPVHP